ncbi:A/G-specific adenine glycosylase [Lacticaseibacillus pabuli]|uniref:Adenine DNA glycosylase n=1 Tax=Lacticaseibacillus pabuli TaxID=3025672 RepID=A0ABY7WPX3_9LACO|nr:A/G-specific adenine glycosylase [Lacticaseibacillus sp. KACC 23028]WDF81716.1 A/G-specific adenine glycosylase [Lacticaseibacillus sp. KACC 23028]
MDWSADKIEAFRKTLLAWYDQEGRALPWRVDHDPYHVMVSEIMLQQTQVETVKPYYARFLKQFPTAAALADAPEALVLKAWEGLGYYSRARNLQRAAQQITQEHGGVWPQTADELVKLAGIGPYTAGAIASIAFNQPEPAIDGNAFRVFARLFCIEDDITLPKTRRVFDTLIRQLIDPDRPGDFNQAIMDLGSTYMRAKDPDAAHSPVAAFDASLAANRVLDFPVKTKKKPPVVVPYYALVIYSDQGYLLVKRPKTGMLANMWMFPLIKRTDLTADTLDDARATAAKMIGHAVYLTAAGTQVVKHTFTHQQWQLTLLTAEASAFDVTDFGGRWVQAANFDELALPTVQKKLIRVAIK